MGIVLDCHVGEGAEPEGDGTGRSTQPSPMAMSWIMTKRMRLLMQVAEFLSQGVCAQPQRWSGQLRHLEGT